MNGNSVRAGNLPFYPKISSYASLNAFEVIEIGLVAEKYKIRNEKKLISTLFCESSLDNSKVGSSGEIGIAQFKQKTWNYFNKVRGLDLDIYNKADQIDMFMWAIKSGYQEYWTCW